MAYITEYLELKQIAKELKVGVVTIRRYIKSGKLVAKKFGKEYRILRKDLDSFVNNASTINSPETRELEKFHDEGTNEDIRDIVGKKPKPNHSKVFLGINSNIMEAIVEMSSEIPMISDLKVIIAEHAKGCLSLIKNIEKEGIKDTKVAINLLLIDDAIKNLNIRRNLFSQIINNKVLVLLPLPPHLSDPLLVITHHDSIIIVDKNLPPHLRNQHYSNLDFIPLVKVEELSGNTEAIVTEGYMENDRLYLRQNVANLIFQANKNKLRDIFIHSIPHIAPDACFVEFDTRNCHLNLINI